MVKTPWGNALPALDTNSSQLEETEMLFDDIRNMPDPRVLTCLFVSLGLRFDDKGVVIEQQEI